MHFSNSSTLGENETIVKDVFAAPRKRIRRKWLISRSRNRGVTRQRSGSMRRNLEMCKGVRITGAFPAGWPFFGDRAVLWSSSRFLSAGLVSLADYAKVWD